MSPDKEKCHAHVDSNLFFIIVFSSFAQVVPYRASSKKYCVLHSLSLTRGRESGQIVGVFVTESSNHFSLDTSLYHREQIDSSIITPRLDNRREVQLIMQEQVAQEDSMSGGHIVKHFKFNSKGRVQQKLTIKEISMTNTIDVESKFT